MHLLMYSHCDSQRQRTMCIYEVVSSNNYSHFPLPQPQCHHLTHRGHPVIQSNGPISWKKYEVGEGLLWFFLSDS